MGSNLSQQVKQIGGEMGSNFSQCVKKLQGETEPEEAERIRKEKKEDEEMALQRHLYREIELKKASQTFKMEVKQLTEKEIEEDAQILEEKMEHEHTQRKLAMQVLAETISKADYIAADSKYILAVSHLVCSVENVMPMRENDFENASNETTNLMLRQ